MNCVAFVSQLLWLARKLPASRKSAKATMVSSQRLKSVSAISLLENPFWSVCSGWNLNRWKTIRDARRIDPLDAVATDRLSFSPLIWTPIERPNRWNTDSVESEDSMTSEALAHRPHARHILAPLLSS